MLSGSVLEGSDEDPEVSGVTALTVISALQKMVKQRDKYKKLVRRRSAALRCAACPPCPPAPSPPPEQHAWPGSRTPNASSVSPSACTRWRRSPAAASHAPSARAHAQAETRAEKLEQLQTRMADLQEKNERFMEENTQLMEQRLERSQEDSQAGAPAMVAPQRGTRRLRRRATSSCWTCSRRSSGSAPSCARRPRRCGHRQPALLPCLWRTLTAGVRAAAGGGSGLQADSRPTASRPATRGRCARHRQAVPPPRPRLRKRRTASAQNWRRGSPCWAPSSWRRVAKRASARTVRGGSGAANHDRSADQRPPRRRQGAAVAANRRPQGVC
jgi:hypothetical protein